MIILLTACCGGADNIAINTDTVTTDTLEQELSDLNAANYQAYLTEEEYTSGKEIILNKYQQ